MGSIFSLFNVMLNISFVYSSVASYRLECSTILTGLHQGRMPSATAAASTIRSGGVPISADSQRSGRESNGRRSPDVLAHHADTIRVLHTLRPSAMAGEGEFDPFRD
jgi:hypothetical protein